jgi:hypothetical protein
MAAQALASAGFFVSVPIFTAPAFDLVAKWGRAIHAIQIKTGHIKPNGKTVQWPTSHIGRFYHKNDCSFFGLVLIPKGEIWWLPVEVIGPRSSVCTNIDTDQLAEFRGNFESLKKCD